MSEHKYVEAFGYTCCTAVIFNIFNTEVMPRFECLLIFFGIQLSVIILYEFVFISLLEVKLFLLLPNFSYWQL